jgi:hypothetical protein
VEEKFHQTHDSELAGFDAEVEAVGSGLVAALSPFRRISAYQGIANNL